MPLKINAQTIASFAEEKLGHRPSIESDVLTAVHFYRNLGQVPHCSDVTVFGRNVQAAITSSISACDRLLSPDIIEALDSAPLLALERFAIVHFVSAQRAFLRGLEVVASEVDLPTEDAGQQRKDAAVKKTRVTDEITHAVAAAMGLDLPFTIAVDPRSQLGPYYGEQLEIVATILSANGAVWKSRDTLKRCIEIAMQEYAAWLSREAASSGAVTSFLNFKQQRQQSNVVLDNVEGLSEALSNWLKENDLGERRREKWRAYRETLAELPDDASTMFDENFGVRKVFVQPEATYKVAGVKREAIAQVSDVAGLLGTLISDRTQSDDLILLCGGPGSGKSTLCRILASELATNDQVHPVFLRLRRLQDSQDITGFIESHLQQEGLIDRLSDLSSVPNLVLILDGFDELVMASRTKLREFFNALKDDLASGPLRHAKAIVSGRDTLFPNGAGLPMGAHVVSLLPFDRPRITAWGSKWRSLHSVEDANGFYPEKLVREDKKQGHRAAPLEHLVSWPLTLHLVARAHTSGSINLKPETASQVEKALLYRSIVADTALRQENQASGRGRLDPNQMRRFVQAIAWEMYSTGREALDVSEGLPILRTILPEATDADLVELADVTIVNQPELTKGDETGFEFVHKSFSEYFAAEQIATGLERVCFQSKQWGVEDKTWAMSVRDATSMLSSLFGVRLLTAEVQEMLEPMLGDFSEFIDGTGSPGIRSDAQSTIEKMKCKLDRFESLLGEFASGELLDVVSTSSNAGRPKVNPLESFGNYLSAMMFVSVALSRRMRQISGGTEYCVTLSPHVLIRIIHMVLSGDIQIDYSYADRGLANIDVSAGESHGMEMLFPPIAPAMLGGVRGLDTPLTEAVSVVTSELAFSQIENVLLSTVMTLTGGSPSFWERRRHMRYDYRMRNGPRPVEYLQRIVNAGASPYRVDEASYNFERHFFMIMDELRHSRGLNIDSRDLERAVFLIRDVVQDGRYQGIMYPEMYERAEMILRELIGGGRVAPRRAPKPRVPKAKTEGS